MFFAAHRSAGVMYDGGPIASAAVIEASRVAYSAAELCPCGLLVAKPELLTRQAAHAARRTHAGGEVIMPHVAHASVLFSCVAVV